MDWPHPVFIRRETGLFFFFFFCPHSLFFFLLLLPQVVYFTEMYKIFSELTDQIDQAGLTDEQRERETEAKLSELRALSIVADDWGRKAENWEGLLSCLSEWIALFSGSFARFQSGQNLIISLFPCGLISPHSSCTTLPCFIRRLSATQSSWNATLTKPSAKCSIISQYVFYF